MVSSTCTGLPVQLLARSTSCRVHPSTWRQCTLRGAYDAVNRSQQKQCSTAGRPRCTKAERNSKCGATRGSSPRTSLTLSELPCTPAESRCLPPGATQEERTCPIPAQYIMGSLGRCSLRRLWAMFLAQNLPDPQCGGLRGLLAGNSWAVLDIPNAAFGQQLPCFCAAHRLMTTIGAASS